jgi:hypothetical protein
VKGTIVVFARAPQWGRVKTRLARGIGPGPALAAYRTMLAQTLALARDARWRCVVAVTPDNFPAPSCRAIVPGIQRAKDWIPGTSPGMTRRRIADPSFTPQGRGSLGVRMERVFRTQSTGPVVIVGTDCPAMRRADIAAAFRALGRADAVFGPAEDGGYWLIGLKRTRGVPKLFQGVRWSSEHALADTLASLPRGWRIAMLRTLSDVDTADEWRNQKAALSFPSASA